MADGQVYCLFLAEGGSVGVAGARVFAPSPADLLAFGGAFEQMRFPFPARPCSLSRQDLLEFFSRR